MSALGTNKLRHCFEWLPTHIILIDLKTDLVLYEDVCMIVGEYDMTN